MSAGNRQKAKRPLRKDESVHATVSSGSGPEDLGIWGFVPRHLLGGMGGRHACSTSTVTTRDCTLHVPTATALWANLFRVALTKPITSGS